MITPNSIKDVFGQLRKVSPHPPHTIIIHPDAWKALPGSDKTKRLRKKRYDALLRMLGHK